MKLIKHTLSPLAIVFIALAGVLALSSTANAQSTSTVQMKYSGTATSEVGKAVTALDTGGAGLQPLNTANFRQRWQRDNLGANVFRFDRAGFSNACLRVPNSLAPSAGGTIEVGSCSGTRAQWRRQFAAGAGDIYVNVGTGHVLSPELCIAGPCSGRIGVLPSSIVGGATDLFRWTTTIL
jgi:hypothetical protein